MGQMEQLLSLLKGGNWEEGESLWTEILQDKLESIEPLKPCAHEFARRGEKERLLELLNLTVMACSEANNPSLWVDSLRWFAKYNPSQRSLVKDFTTAFKKKYEHLPYLAKWVDKVLLENLPPHKFIKTLDKLVIFQEGTVVKHRSGWGIGKVTSISEEKMDIMVDLERRPDHRMDALAAADCLTPLANDHFETLVAFNIGVLQEEAEKKPLELIHRVLLFIGKPLGAREFKKYLSPDVIPDDKWSKWWTKTRKQMVTDPFIDNAASAHGKFAYRDKPKDWEEEARQAFEASEELDQPMEAGNYLKNSQEKKLVSFLAEKLLVLCQNHCKEEKYWYALEAYIAIEDCIKEGAKKPEELPSLEKMFSSDPIAIFKNLRLSSQAQQTIEVFTSYDDKWEEKIYDIFLYGSDLSRDALFRYLTKKRLWSKYLPNIYQLIMDQRTVAPDAFTWLGHQLLSRKIKGQNIPELVDIYLNVIQTFTTLKFLRQLDTQKSNKIFILNLADKVTLSLKPDDELDANKALEVYNATHNAMWIPSSFKSVLKLNIREKFPKFFRKTEPIFTTKKGLQKYEEEYQELIRKKIPENSEAIGRALSFGDLSENSELDAAREDQIQLMKKAQEMQTNLNDVKLIEFDELTTDQVEVGSTVTLTNSNGEKTLYTLLGPWDVDLNQGIISFMSPIAKELIGKNTKDKVSLPAGDYEVADIQIYSGAD